MNEPTKRAWSEPELIALERSRSEEAVLSVCKVYLDNSGSLVDIDYCSNGGTPNCVACTDASHS